MLSLLLEEFALSQTIVLSGQQVVPRFAIVAPEGEFTVFVPLPDDVHARARSLGYMREFLAWKAASGFVLSIETWLGHVGAPPDEDLHRGEAIVSTLVSRSEVVGVMRLIDRSSGISFGAVQMFGRETVDDIVLDLLPDREATLTPEMLSEVGILFGAGGEFEARRVH